MSRKIYRFFTMWTAAVSEKYGRLWAQQQEIPTKTCKCMVGLPSVLHEPHHVAEVFIAFQLSRSFGIRPTPSQHRNLLNKPCRGLRNQMFWEAPNFFKIPWYMSYGNDVFSLGFLLLGKAFDVGMSLFQSMSPGQRGLTFLAWNKTSPWHSDGSEPLRKALLRNWSKVELRRLGLDQEIRWYLRRLLHFGKALKFCSCQKSKKKLWLVWNA